MSSKATRKRYLEQECKNIRKRVEKFLGNDRSFLEEPYGTRRQKAILNYLDKAENDFGSYGLNSVIKAFANQELVPLLNYDEINYDFELSIGAAIWMLNKLRANNEASEVYKAIPPSDDWFYALPIDFSYPSYSNNLINSVVQLLTFRYEKKPISGDHPREGEILYKETAIGRKPNEAYQNLLKLLPEDDIKAACDEFRTKLWELSGRRLKAFAWYEKEANKLERLYNSIMSHSHESSVSSPMSSASPLLNPAMMKDIISPGHDLKDDLNKLVEYERRARAYSDKESKMNYFFDEYLWMDKAEIQKKTGSSKVAEAIHGFTVRDPYELCFALFYLLDTGDDAPWLMTSSCTLMKYCLNMLPWYIPGMDDWTDEEWDEWEEDIPFNRNEWIKNEPAEDSIDLFHQRYNGMNLAQTIFKLCHIVVPSGLHPFEEDRKKLVEDGMDEEAARTVTETADLLFLSAYNDNFGWREKLESVLRENEEAEQDEEEDKTSAADENETLRRDLSNALKQVKSYRNALAAATQEANKEKAKYEQELKELRMEHRELADLRELVFNREAQDQDRIEKVEKQYSYPYETRKRTVVFGGHDSFLRAFKPMFENVKFVDAGNMTYSPEIIRNADVVWIQNNCISHPQYWSIVKNCKRSGVQMRYFAFASAEKCAEQLVTEDMK